MTRPKVLISDSMSSQAVAVFEERGVEVVQSSKLTEAELFDMIGEFDGLAIRSSTKVTAKLLEHASNLKVVGRAGIGVDNVDRVAATRAGVVVMNTPEGNATTTAEHAISLIMSSARMIPQANASMKAGKWGKEEIRGSRVARPIR